MDWLFKTPWKTYLAAAGLFGLAVYQLSNKDYQHSYETFMASLALVGVRHAIQKM